MLWWMWVLAGLALLVAELATPGGFFLFFFGLSALAVALLSVLGFAPWVQWLVFPVLAVLGVVFFRGALAHRFSPRRSVDNFAGEEAVVIEDVAPGGVGKAELRGTVWTARTSHAASLPKGQRARVERVEGLTLWLRVQ
jgi:membrane protein implicated in regulation of membrane protease activity